VTFTLPQVDSHSKHQPIRKNLLLKRINHPSSTSGTLKSIHITASLLPAYFHEMSSSPMDTQDAGADAEVQEMMGFATFGMQKPGMSVSNYSDYFFVQTFSHLSFGNQVTLLLSKARNVLPLCSTFAKSVWNSYLQREGTFFVLFVPFEQHQTYKRLA
jgi:hypothetical protein